MHLLLNEKSRCIVRGVLYYRLYQHPSSRSTHFGNPKVNIRKGGITEDKHHVSVVQQIKGGKSVKIRSVNSGCWYKRRKMSRTCLDLKSRVHVLLMDFLSWDYIVFISVCSTSYIFHLVAVNSLTFWQIFMTCLNQFYLTTQSTHFICGYMAINERGNALPPLHGLFIPINSNMSCIRTIPLTI